MRALLVLMTVALVGGWAAVRHLPREAQAEPVMDARPQEIVSVALDGERGLPLGALRDVLETKVGSLIDLPMIQRDRTHLIQALVERGYLAARVGDARVTFGAGGAVYVTYPITQGPLFRIRNVTVDGASATEAGVVTLDGGQIADADAIALARKSVEQRLRVRGKQSAVESVLSLDNAAGLVDLELRAH